MTDNNSDKIMVTGCRGMVGRAVVDLLRLDGDREVVALDRQALDITDEKRVVEAVGDLRPGAIINAAARTDIDAAEADVHVALAVNGRGVRNLALAAERYHVFLCHFSCAEVFEGKSSTPYREWDDHWPRSRYGESKDAGEKMLAAIWDGFVLIRSGWLYGAGRDNFVDRAAAALRAGEKVRAAGDIIGAPTYAGDLAAAAITLSDARARGYYHFSNDAGDGVSPAELAREIARLTGMPETLVEEVREADLERAPRPAYAVLRLEKFREMLPGLVRPWRDALAAYLSGS
ncbi:MAG: NAD(P)-dependent oxidoreductase [Deltaproteobacteria bacterium]|nr:NAD(P)-dependent oxidoreductase [Candidatus Anaeroferrophillacea bacterium]